MKAKILPSDETTTGCLIRIMMKYKLFLGSGAFLGSKKESTSVQFQTYFLIGATHLKYEGNLGDD